ncbi:hypothetical protein EDC04DRAFT_2922911 [Pisolithus marmoratus]|nr:hypothetical protein EDC04DRAFT_2922911 [Pisolithus marmoratus]
MFSGGGGGILMLTLTMVFLGFIHWWTCASNVLSWNKWGITDVVSNTHTSQASYINATHSNNHHCDAQMPGSGSSGSGTTSASASPDASGSTSPNIDTLDSATYEFGEDRVGVHGVHSVGTAETSGSELMGALGGDNITSGYGSVSSLNMSGLGGMPMNMNSMGLGMDGEEAANGGHTRWHPCWWHLGTCL